MVRCLAEIWWSILYLYFIPVLEVCTSVKHDSFHVSCSFYPSFFFCSLRPALLKKKKRTEDENFFLFKMKCAFLVHMISIDIAHVPFPSSGSPAVNTPRRLLTMVTCVSDSGARLMACACTLVSHSCMSVCAYAALTRYYVMNLPDTTVRLLSSIMSP